ncbi:MAG TPA: DnaJ domain-containing protein, partial [Vicinamibacterales bacterium]|nr:DnaJ domain-containing protein [Vicinamibacterales bacterium]
MPHGPEESTQKPTSIDYYEVLQISPNAEPDTIQRVYRLLAQRYHPDNQETGNTAKFRLIHEAYAVLSDPDVRVKY